MTFLKPVYNMVASPVVKAGIEIRDFSIPVGLTSVCTFLPQLFGQDSFQSMASLRLAFAGDRLRRPQKLDPQDACLSQSTLRLVWSLFAGNLRVAVPYLAWGQLPWSASNRPLQESDRICTAETISQSLGDHYHLRSICVDKLRRFEGIDSPNKGLGRLESEVAARIYRVVDGQPRCGDVSGTK